MQLGSIFILALSTVASGASFTSLLPEVKYGSGTAHAALRVIWNCQIDPGHVCGGLAAICGAALANPGADLSSRITSCTGMALWCGAQTTLNIMFCLVQVPSLAGNPEVNVPQSIINDYSNYAGSAFTQDVLSLNVIQDNSVKNPDMNIVDDTMIKLTGCTVMVPPASTNNHQDYCQRHERGPGFICGYLGVKCMAANPVWRGGICGVASAWYIGQVACNEIACPSKIWTLWKKERRD